MNFSRSNRIPQVLLLTAGLATPIMAQNLTQFANGQTADANAVNANFSSLKSAVDAANAAATAAQATADAAQASAATAQNAASNAESNVNSLTSAITVTAPSIGVDRTIQFPQSQNGRKLVFDDINANQYYGFGISQATLRYHVSNSNGNHAFYAGTSSTNANELMRIQGNGNVGIGTSTPQAPLEVARSGSGYVLQLRGNPLVSVRFQNDGPAINWDIVHDNTGWAVSRSGVDYPFGILENGAVAIGTNRSVTSGFKLEVGGNIRCVSLTQTSSRDLKRDIAPLSGALDSIMKLRSVSYAWSDKAPEDVQGKRDIGFIADEVDAVLPEIVAKDGSGKAIGIAYGKVTSVTVGAIQELKLENDDLRQRLASLEAAVAQLQPLLAARK